MFNFFKKEVTVLRKSSIVQEEDFTDIAPIATYFHKETGITFDKQLSILKSKVSTFCKQREIYSFTTLLAQIKSDQSLKQDLIDHLTTNETYFYRELKQIMQLVDLVKVSSTKVSILCAPSATGEEPYSIAIALLEAGVPSSRFSILGIDINADAIKQSKEALYTDKNLRNLSTEIISKYFSRDKQNYILHANIKSLVSFSVANLFDDSFKNIGKFDFVFSRNMLIYFDKY